MGFFVLLALGGATAAAHTLRVSDPALAKALVAQGDRLVADYGSFQVLEDNSVAVTSVLPGKVELADELNFIKLNTGALDTRTPQTQGLRKAVGNFSGRRLHLVQFIGPVKPEWRQALEQSGVEIVSYVPNDAYLVYGDAPALARMQTWAQAADSVQWDGDYADSYRIHPRAQLTDANGNPQNPGTDTFAVQLVDDTNANPATLALIDQLKLAPVQSEFRILRYLNVIVRLPPGELSHIAAQPEVVSIQPYYERRKLDEAQDQIMAGNLAGNAPAGPGYLAWLASKGFSQAQFDASGFVVDVSDSGIDNGTSVPGHFGLYATGNPAQASRVVYSRLEGKANPGSTLEGCDGHGTLNAHILAGYDDLAAGFPHTDLDGFHYGLGVCPFVKLGASVVFDPDLFTNPNYPNLQSQAYHSGARISANSWGSDVSGQYDVDAQAYDALVRDAQPAGSTYATAGNQPMVIVFAAGNAGPTAQSVDSPGSAKNVITVGAAENVRSLSPSNGGSDSLGNDGCYTPDSAADNANDVLDFSSQGPCADGRMKPDLVAPGSHVTGGVGQSGAPTTNGLGSAISCYNASGVCGLPGSGTAGSAQNFFPLNQEWYTVSSGTSHATPAVAGACALLRQYYLNANGLAPSPAMTKAWLMNSTRYLSGAYAGDSLWSPSQGMGEVDLGTAFDGVPRVLRDQVAEDKFTASGQTRTFVGTITDPTAPFRVTLAWTDAPGSTSGSAFNNDLDLTVTVGGNTYKGNVFSGAFSITGGGYDRENNVESVFLPAGVSGAFTVTVTAANINSDGVPNEAPSLDQDFALVVYNASQAPTPVVVLDQAWLVAETCQPTNGVIDPGETVAVAFSLKNLGTADTTNLTVTLLDTNGVIAAGPPQEYGTLVAGGAAQAQTFTFTATGFCGGGISPVLELENSGTNLGTISTSFPLGRTVSTTGAATNSASVAIPAVGTTVGPASPYPSPITVSGITGLVSKVTVTFVGVTHTYPDDIDAVLVGPDGSNVMLMSDCGGGLPIAGLTLTFDDDAAASLPDASQITSGTYKPTNYDPASDNLPAPAPVGPFGGTLSVFSGSNPNGTWSLYIQDDASQDTGSITQGWRINITTSNAVCCAQAAPMADLALGQSATPSLTNLGGVVLFTLSVTNFGPDPADAIAVSDFLPAGFDFLSAQSSQGTWTNQAGEVTASLGSLGIGATATVTVRATAVTAGSWTNAAQVTSGTADPAAANNGATAVVFVNSPPTISAIPDLTTNENAVAGPVSFMIGDAESPASNLTLTGESSNTNLAPVGNILFGGNGTNRTVIVIPATNQFGVATITVAVSDGLAATSSSFLLTINHVNQPPILAAIGSRTIFAGSTLVITNTATDPDLPAQTLTFSLGTNAPSGAAIDPVSGVLTWTPVASQAGSTNTITVQVTDNGNPPLSDATTFTVTVVPPPRIESITLTNEVVTLTWSALSGRTYRVQYNADLGKDQWSNLVPDVTATGPTASLQDSLPSAAQRFYRILVP